MAALEVSVQGRKTKNKRGEVSPQLLSNLLRFQYRTYFQNHFKYNFCFSPHFFSKFLSSIASIAVRMPQPISTIRVLNTSWSRYLGKRLSPSTKAAREHATHRVSTATRHDGRKEILMNFPEKTSFFIHHCALAASAMIAPRLAIVSCEDVYRRARDHS